MKQGRSKMRRKNKENEHIEGHCNEDDQQHRGKRFKDVAKKRRTVATSKENQDSKNDGFPRSCPKDDDKSMTLYEAFECVARADYDFHSKGEKYRNRRDNHNKNLNKDCNNKEHQGHRYGVFFKIPGAAAPRLSKSNSLSASTFAKALGKLGHSWWASDKDKGVECRDEINDVCRRPRIRQGATGNRCIVERGGDKASKDDPRDEAVQHEEEEELDPIFVSGSYRNLIVSDNAELDPLDDIAKTESSVVIAPSHPIIDERDDEISDSKVTDDRGSDDGVRDNRVSDDVVVSDDSGAESCERKTSRIFHAHNKLQPSSPSSPLEPEQLWVRNHDKRNELAWVRCAARNRKRPMDFPISKCRKQPQENDDEEMLSQSANTYACAPWFASCGEVFVI